MKPKRRLVVIILSVLLTLPVAAAAAPRTRTITSEINGFRVASGVRPVRYSLRLALAARAQANLLLQAVSQKSGSVPLLAKSLRQVGYRTRHAQIFLGADYESSRVLVANWQQSPLHRGRLRNRAFSQIGVAVVNPPNSTPFESFVVTILAERSSL